MKLKNLYHLDHDSLTYKSFSFKKIFLIGFVLIILSGFIGAKFFSSHSTHAYTEEQLVVMLSESEKENFKPIEVYKYLLKRRAPFPEIMYCQAQLESGFNSELFKSNNNCFGMREPGNRPTFSLGEKNGYADFASWQDCINDRILYSALYLRDVKTEEQYYEVLLKSNYAENMDSYVAKLKQMVKEFRASKEFKELK